MVSGFALDDQRSFESGFNRYINAIGTTLNGNDYTGQTLEGISEPPADYRITSFDSGVQF